MKQQKREISNVTFHLSIALQEILKCSKTISYIGIFTWIL